MYSPSKYSRVNSNVSQGSGIIPGTSIRPSGSKSKRVQVWARIRPTALFAHDSLELLPDGRVSTVMILSFQTDMPGQTVQTKIRLLLEEQSDQGLHCLPFRLHRLDSLLYGRAT